MSIDHLALDDIAARVRACMRCPLHEGRTHAVPGEGAGHDGRLDGEGHRDDGGPAAGSAFSGAMLVGEAPGRKEDETGRPFCGAAGKNLDAALEVAGLARVSVFVTSINKCRPPGNRDPTPAEKAACRPYLMEQIAALRPAVLVALGRHGLSGLVEDAPGRFTDVRGSFLDGPPGPDGEPVPVFCSLHPAAVIYRRTWMDDYLEDWRRLGAWLRGAPMEGWPVSPGL